MRVFFCASACAVLLGGVGSGSGTAEAVELSSLRGRTAVSVSVAEIGVHKVPQRVVQTVGPYGGCSVKATPSSTPGEYTVEYWAVTKKATQHLISSQPKLPQSVSATDKSWISLGPMSKFEGQDDDVEDTDKDGIVDKFKSLVKKVLPKKDPHTYKKLGGDTLKSAKKVVQMGDIALDTGSKIKSKRRDEVKSGVKSLAVDGAMLGFDGLTGGSLGGITATIGAGRSLKAVHDKMKLGKGAKEAAKEAAATGLSEIHPVLAFLRDGGAIAKALFQTPSSRFKGKALKATQFLESVDEQITIIKDIKEQCEIHQFAKQVKDCDQALADLNTAKETAQKWIDGKLKKDSTPLLALHEHDHD